jgi:quercetin dioxygenase-like cupin family protein
MRNRFKNLESAAVFRLADETAYLDGEITSRTLAQNVGTRLAIFAIERGESLETTVVEADALALCLEGVARITVDDVEHKVEAGEALVIPAGTPRSIGASERSKILLIDIF